MSPRNALLAAPLAAARACGGGGTGTGSAALDAATPSAAVLSMDQVATDATSSALVAEAASALTAGAPAIGGAACHPHLFVRQREVVERVNRHLRKALRHVDAVIANSPLTATDTTKTWERVEGGVDRRFTITLVAPGVYSWELDVGAAGTDPLPVVMTGQIDRTDAAGPHQGKGSVHIDFAKLHAGFPAERVSQGTLDVQFDVSAASRKLFVTAKDVAWDLDASAFASAAVVSALSAPRSGAYVYFREPGKGGSLEIQDQMVFACPANASLLPADAQLASRWYRLADGTVHGRSDALMRNGQLPAAGIDHVVGVTCHQSAAEGEVQGEGFWLMKAEDGSGATLSGASSATTSDPGATACDPVFGAVPTLADASADFTGWPAAIDGTPFPFPGM